MKDGETRLKRWIQLISSVLWIFLSGSCVIFVVGPFLYAEGGALFSLLVYLVPPTLVGLIVAVQAARALLARQDED